VRTCYDAIHPANIPTNAQMVAGYVDGRYAWSAADWARFPHSVKARIAGLDPRLEQAAADLYANEAQAFWRVTFPLVAPGIAAGALLAFSLSFDDYIITNFNATTSSITFPMYVWGAAQRGTPVQINVIGTLMFLLALVAVVSGQLLGRRRSARK